MARKIVNRMALREEAEAAEAAQAAGGATEKKTAKRKPAKRKSRAKAAVEVRKKLFWGVFNQSMKLVARFDFDKKDAADRRAEELGKGGKSPHFVQRVKEDIVEA